MSELNLSNLSIMKLTKSVKHDLKFIINTYSLYALFCSTIWFYDLAMFTHLFTFNHFFQSPPLDGCSLGSKWFVVPPHYLFHSFSDHCIMKQTGHVHLFWAQFARHIKVFRRKTDFYFTSSWFLLFYPLMVFNSFKLLKPATSSCCLIISFFCI